MSFRRFYVYKIDKTENTDEKLVLMTWNDLKTVIGVVVKLINEIKVEHFYTVPVVRTYIVTVGDD